MASGAYGVRVTRCICFMLNDRAKQLPAEHPVVMELYNPLGQMYARKTQTRGELGLYVFDFVTERMPPRVRGM